jgi:hypothetical protein
MSPTFPTTTFGRKVFHVKHSTQTVLASLAGYVVGLAAAILLFPAPASAQTTPTWQRIGQEGQLITLTQPQHIRYGANSAWRELDLPAGARMCNNDLIGDPAPGATKYCEQLVSLTAPPPPESPPPSTTPPPVDSTPVATQLYPCFPNEASAKNAALSTQPATTLGWLLDSNASFVATWYCQTAEGVFPQALTGFKRETISFEALALFLAGTPEQKQAIYAASTLTNCRNSIVGECASYAALKTIADAQLAATKPGATPAPPAAPTLKVAVNGTSPDRPVKNFNQDGTVGADVKGERARVGDTCNCATNLAKVGTTTYCSVSGLVNNASTLTPKGALPGNRGAVCK